MIKVIFSAGVTENREVTNFDEIELGLRASIEKLNSVPSADLIKIFDEYGKDLLNSNARNIEGVAFLSNWLKARNLREMLKENLNSEDYLDRFSKSGDGLIKAQPRGVVCHWIAGNVPTLAMFSLVQSVIAKNVNLIRLPESAIQDFSKLIKVFAETCKKSVHGNTILMSITIVHFPSKDIDVNEKFSMIADVRLIWGGAEAVGSISSLKKKSYCEDIVFGPKYSFAVVDKEHSESDDVASLVRKFVRDIRSFGQNACSSPHVIFFETNENRLEFIARIFANEMKNYDQPRENLSRIITKIAEFSMNGKKVIFDKNYKWGVFIDSEIKFEEPICNLTIFLKKTSNLESTLSLITPRIQTIGCAIGDEKRFLKFCEESTLRGAARCVLPGQMNLYETPWDGMLVINRLVRWVSAKGVN